MPSPMVRSSRFFFFFGNTAQHQALHSTTKYVINENKKQRERNEDTPYDSHRSLPPGEHATFIARRQGDERGAARGRSGGLRPPRRSTTKFPQAGRGTQNILAVCFHRALAQNSALRPPLQIRLHALVADGERRYFGTPSSPKVWQKRALPPPRPRDDAPTRGAAGKMACGSWHRKKKRKVAKEAGNKK